MRTLGKYFIFLGSLFVNREKFKHYVSMVLEESVLIGIDSLPIVSIVSLFLGAVSAVQTAYNLISPFIPKYIIGTLVRDMATLELSPTIISIVLAGKVGSHLAGTLGTMRVTEQIDALEVMGINASSYLVLPKILAAVITFPLLVIISMFLIIYGGYIAGTLTGALTSHEYIQGIRYEFIPFNVSFGMIKSFVFAFLISSIASYRGYFTKGGALEVGAASTQAVTSSCIAILFADFLLAKLLLSV